MPQRMDRGYSREENIVQRNKVSRRAGTSTLDESPNLCYARTEDTRSVEVEAEVKSKHRSLDLNLNLLAF
jgi:hypothetical protein